MAKFVISTRKNDEVQFRLQASNGQVILTSEGYTTKAAALNGIESVKTNSQEESKFEKRSSSNDKFYFNLKAGNGQVIGSSQMYENEQSRDKGINSVMSNAPAADIDDQTV